MIDIQALENIPEEMRQWPNFVAWRYEVDRDGKTQKMPYNPQTGGKAMSNNPATWSTFDHAVKFAADNEMAGLFFALTKETGYIGFDYDDCIEADGLPVNDVYVEICLLNSYCEYSPSREGLRLIAKGELPQNVKTKEIELYHHHHFVSLTGWHMPGTPKIIKPAQEEIAKIYNRIETSRAKPEPVLVLNGNGHHPTLADQEIINKASAAANGHKFDCLFRGDFGGYGSQSEADLALCSILTFWTSDDQQVDRIFRQSQLMRSKWNDKHNGNGETYGQMTINTARLSQTENYQSNGASGNQAQSTESTTYSFNSGADLLNEVLPEPVWAVPGKLPIGLTILGGLPKLGKSWLALQLSLAVCSGGIIFNQRVERGRVLYIALEDNKRRLQDRMRQQKWRIEDAANFDYMLRSEFFELIGGLDSGSQIIANQIEINGYRLVVIDTLGRAFSNSKVLKDQNAYQQISSAFDPIQSTAMETNCAILAIDHHHKGVNSDHITPDSIADIQGSISKGGVADSVWGLYKSRIKPEALLQIDGRDIPEILSLAIKMDRETAAWQLHGDYYEQKQTEGRNAILAMLEDEGPLSCSKLAQLLGRKVSNVHYDLKILVADRKVNKDSDKLYHFIKSRETP